VSTIAVPSSSAATNGARLEDALRAAGYEIVVTPSGAANAWTSEQLRDVFGTVDAVVASPARPYPAELFEAAPRLRLITSPVIGVDTIDVDAASEFGVLVANCPTPENVMGIAEATVMLIVALQLNLKQKERSLREGHFRPQHASHLLHGQTVGLIGYGRIAHNVEQRLQGWGVTVQAADPYVPGTLGLDDLLRTSDVVSLHVVLTSQTRNMIGARELALMKPGSILVNTSRGGAIVEDALAEAIDSGQISRAALDVFQQEPIDMDNPLLRCDPDRVILTPHAIGHNLETGPSGVQMALDNIERALRGELPESVINPEIIPAWRRRLAMLEP
jgi:D-3-phosphoglycerate dehydrogenase / 2-oxoglutarate reductase